MVTEASNRDVLCFEADVLFSTVFDWRCLTSTSVYHACHGFWRFPVPAPTSTRNIPLPDKIRQVPERDARRPDSLESQESTLIGVRS